MAESTRIEYGDTEYDEIWTAWDTNGRSSIFDYTRDSDYGGSIIRVLAPTDTYPDFYRACSLKAATWDNDEESDNVQWKGRWPALNEDYEKVVFTIDSTDPRKVAVRGIRFEECPNELS